MLTDDVLIKYNVGASEESRIIVYWYTEASEVCNTALENVSSTAVCPIPLEDLLCEEHDFRFINCWFIFIIFA